MGESTKTVAAAPVKSAGAILPEGLRLSLSERPRLLRGLSRDRWIYALMLPGLFYYVVFQYLPLLGNVIAFQDYRPFRGIRDSE